ncbi:MAG TPA: MFS transporter [Pilimelia sp.]|nr:MFS transporter [Pilimelia sp.]
MTVAMASASALGSPAFRRYLIGQVPSVTCSWAQVVALSWCVVATDPAALGWVVALQFTPSLVLGPWFGTVTDRYDRKRILMVAEAGLGLVAAGYAVAAATGRLTLPLIYALAAAWGVINALDTPARQALIPALVRPEHAARASALTGVVLLIGMTTGSALGAALVTTAGAAAAFAVNAASFLLDLLLLATIRVRARPGAGRAPRQLRDGFAYVWRTPRVRAPLLALAVVGTLGFTVQVSVPVLTHSFAAGPSLVGTSFTAVTTGALAGAVVAAIRGRLGPRTLRQAAAVMAAAMAITAVAPTVPVLLGGLAGIGFGWSVLIAATVAILQTAPTALLGRVMSWLAVVVTGGTAVGGPLAGAVAELAGPRAPFVLGAAAAVAAGVIMSSARIGGLFQRDLQVDRAA